MNNLLRGPSETYNPQIHTEELSLTTQMDKDNAVRKQVIDRFSRYTKFTSFLFQTGRVDGGVKQGWITRPSADGEIHDNAYRVKYKSINIKPAYSMGSARIGEWYDNANPKPDMSSIVGVTYAGGATATTVKTDMYASIAIKHNPANDIFGDKFNPQDSIRLDSGLGTMFWIQRIRPSSTGDHFILDCKVIGQPTDFKEEGLAEDEVLMEGGNYYGEGSLRGYQRYQQNYWRIFYSFISRYSLTFTGNALDQRKVIWASPSNNSQGQAQPLWQYEQEWDADALFPVFIELACRFSVSSMDPSTHTWYENSGKNLLTLSGQNPEAGILPPRTSDGWISQIKDTIDLDYDVNDGLSPYKLESITAMLSANSPSGSSGNKFVILGDMIGRVNFDRAMKSLMGWNVSNGGTLPGSHNTNIVYNISNNKEVKLGFEVKSYEYLGNEIIFMEDELFSHPGLVGRSGGLTGTGNLYILNVTPFNGVSNFELFTRGLGRFFKKKYVNGLHSLQGEDSKFAASGFDGAFCHYLTEMFPICYAPDTCAVIRGKGKYSGGALAGNAQLANFPTIM